VRRGKKPGECEVSIGCASCYVTRIWRRNPDAWPDLTTWYPDKLDQLRRCRPRPGKTPYRRGPDSRPLVFVCDTGDLFHARVPAAFIFEALDVMAERSDIDFQVLTKREHRAHGLILEWLKSRDWARLPPWMAVRCESGAKGSTFAVRVPVAYV
jgi:protein gp37